MLRIGSIAGIALTAAAVLSVGVVQADVVLDMPPPPTTESATVQGDDAATLAPATKKAPKTALARFGVRQQAQDSAGNPRGVNISSTFSNGAMGWGGQGWGGQGWGWSGYWGISPWLLMSGWGGGCCAPWGWAEGCSGYGGGYGFGWSGSSISIGSGVNLRIGNVGWIR